MSGRRFLGILAAAGAALLTLPAAAQPTGYMTSMRFLDQIRGQGAGPTIPGPAEARINRKSNGALSTEAIPIARAGALLSQCREAGSMYGGSQYRSGASVGTRYFECLEPGALDKNLAVEVGISPDGASVEALDIYPGVDIFWTPPAPNPPGWKPAYDSAKFPAYKATAHAFLAAIEQQGGSLKTLELADFVAGKPATLSPRRAAEIMKPCKEVFTRMDAVIPDKGMAPLDAVIVYFKCEPRSSAPEDIKTWVAFVDGKPVYVQVQAAHDYRIPPSAAPAEKQ